MRVCSLAGAFEGCYDFGVVACCERLFGFAGFRAAASVCHAHGSLVSSARDFAAVDRPAPLVKNSSVSSGALSESAQEVGVFGDFSCIGVPHADDARATPRAVYGCKSVCGLECWNWLVSGWGCDLR